MRVTPKTWPLVAIYHRDAFTEDVEHMVPSTSACDRIEVALTPDNRWALHEESRALHGYAWSGEENDCVFDFDDTASLAAQLAPYARMERVDHGEAVVSDDAGWKLSWRLDTDDLGPYLRSSEEACFTVLDKEAFAPIQEAIDEL